MVPVGGCLGFQASVSFCLLGNSSWMPEHEGLCVRHPQPAMAIFLALLLAAEALLGCGGRPVQPCLTAACLESG